MSFLAPIAFLLTLLLPVLIIMYLLRLRRTEQLVSSTYLWQRMVRDLEANTPWQRLRRNLLLILQLLFLFTIILALARPFTWTEGFNSKAAIIIIDTSASMAATDVSPNRLQAAKMRAHNLIDSLPNDSRLTVIAAGYKAQVMLSSSLDRRQAHQVIADIQVGTGGSDLSVALQLASAIADQQPDTETIVLSDGGATLPDHLSMRGSLRYLPVGLDGENQAISLLSLEPSSGNDSLNAFVQITNYGKMPASRRLALYSAGQLHKVYDLQIPPGQVKALVADGLPAEAHQVEARLLDIPPSEGASPRDNLPTDDRAFAVMRQSDMSRVILVTEGNLFLDTALSLLPGIELTTIRPVDLIEPVPGVDAVVYDGYAQLTATLPVANSFFIGPIQSASCFTITGMLENPIPKPASSDHPLLENILLDEVNILDAAYIPLPAWARPVIIADNPNTTDPQPAPLLFVGECNDQRVAVLAFDLRHSDLPLQIAYPILISNLMDWLAPGSEETLPLQVYPGTALSFSIPARQNASKITSVTVTQPDGASERLEIDSGGFTYTNTYQPGIYQVRWNDEISDQESIEFAVNLFSPQESNTAPLDILALASAPEITETSGAQLARLEWWRAVALFALFLLMVEWLVYQRPLLAHLFRHSRVLLRRNGP